MRIGKTIGTVTLVEPHQTMRGGVLKLVVPLSHDELYSQGHTREPIVAWDDLGAGDGQLVAFSWRLLWEAYEVLFTWTFQCKYWGAKYTV